VCTEGKGFSAGGGAACSNEGEGPEEGRILSGNKYEQSVG